MGYRDKFNLWKNDPFFDGATRKELASLKDEKEAEDRFYRDLEFGTGGLRGVMGAGTNRMNKYTVGRATSGLADWLIASYGAGACAERGVVIAYDTRNRSADFAEVSAAVLSAKGICVRLYRCPVPTPELSFSVRETGALAGIVITASHNPKEYNGYKVYDSDGCQIVPSIADKVTEYVNAVTDIRSVVFDRVPALISRTDLTDRFVEAVLRQGRPVDGAAKANLKIVYTPLHGTGYTPVCRVLAADGFTAVETVREQSSPDGNFPTVPSPNPEDRRALKAGMEQAKTCGADIVIGTDPDCDRVGVAVREKKGYTLLTGNQTGALLTDFIIHTTDISGIYKPALVKTVVTSDLGAEIAKRNGITVFSTLTGFKYIGEKITQFEKAKKESDRKRDYTFLFGYEESYGYLAGTHSRDKDGVSSSLLVCEAAAYWKARGMTLTDRLGELYGIYGYYLDALDSFTLKGRYGLERISDIMASLRLNGSPFDGTKRVTDFSVPVKAEGDFGYLPPSDVLKYTLSDGSWIAVRPSGTEPKIKIYYSMKGSSGEDAKVALDRCRDTVKRSIGLAKK